MPSDPSIVIYEVDPERLARGTWCQKRQRQIGRGDIDRSYSADTIGLGDSVRRPFEFRGELWVCIGTGGVPGGWRAYRLVPAEAFKGSTTSYTEKTRGSEAARNEPMGFYHAMRVTHGTLSFVLYGPEAMFVAGERLQLNLFRDL